jgi:hypothetical protein
MAALFLSFKKRKYQLMFVPFILAFVLLPAGITAQPNMVQDTLVLRTPCVIFYECTKLEYDSLFQEMAFSLDSLVQQFETTKKKLIPFLNKMNVPFFSTEATTFIFLGKDTLCYIREPFHALAGIILFSPTKGHELLSGKTSDVIAIGRILHYFQLH